MRLEPDALFPQFPVEVIEAALEPRALDADLQVLQADLKKLIFGEGGPSKFTRHGASQPTDKDDLPAIMHRAERVSRQLFSSRALVLGIGIKQLLAIDLVVG